MPRMIQLRHVPDDLHRTLKARAALEGLSLSDYLLREIVVDASAILELLLNTPHAPRVAERLFAARETLHAPHLLDLEVVQVLRRHAAAGALSEPRGIQALEDLGDLPLERYPHHLFVDRIWALRHNLTAYDAVYVALAEALAAPLVTRDATLARGRHQARVEVL
jgi:predicted nucleic acid-binding protein